MRNDEINDHMEHHVYVYIPLASKPYKFVGCKLKPWV